MRQVKHLLKQHDWVNGNLHTKPFEIAAFWPRLQSVSDHLVVYIEGDGFAWRSRSTPSADPTPINPLALRLALVRPADGVAYLGRPCQYVGANRHGCSQRYWTHARFSPEVIEAMDSALNQLKDMFDARRLTLVGYSGGGAVAALLAVRRSDVIRLVTVAANLDHEAWTEYHRLSPLRESLNPIDDAIQLREISQVHFVGSADIVVPPKIVHTFKKRLGHSPRVDVQTLSGFDHECCWVEAWPRLNLVFD